jgi:peptidyl-prolyl cis-trans isomerase SurA
MSASLIMRIIRLHHFKPALLLLGVLATGAVFAQPAGSKIKPAKPAATTPAAGAATPAAVAGAGFLPPAAADANVIDQIAVVVNDEVITRNEVNQRVAQIEANMRAKGAQIPDAADLKRQVVEQMVATRAQLQMAKEMGVRVDDATLDRAIASIAEQQKMTVQEMRNQMEKEGMTYTAFREEIRGEISMQRLRQHEVDSKIQVSDAEVDTYLLAEAAANAERVDMDISQILVRIPDNATADQIAARKSRADDVARQLRTGADFAKMASSFSDAPDALKGGAIGWRDPNGLPPLFANELRKLSKGQITPVIKSNTGFHILRLNDTRSAAKAVDKATVQQTHVRHILLKVSPTMTAVEAKRKLAEMKERIDNKAATFEELARLNSNDGSAAKGGDLGWLFPGDTVPEFENVMNGLKIGEVSDVVETQYGYHLIQVIERKSEDASKERERNAARQVIRERKLEEAAESWVREVRDRAYVEYRDDQH